MKWWPSTVRSVLERSTPSTSARAAVANDEQNHSLGVPATSAEWTQVKVAAGWSGVMSVPPPQRGFNLARAEPVSLADHTGSRFSYRSRSGGLSASPGEAVHVSPIERRRSWSWRCTSAHSVAGSAP